MKKVAFTLLFAILLIKHGWSQSIIVAPATLNVTGGFHTIGNYNFEWSIGEATAITTMTSNNPKIGYVTNGILQPLYSIPNLEDCKGDFSVKIFPNPTNGRIEIDFFSLLPGKVTMNLFDESGRLLEVSPFDYTGSSIINHMDLSRYPSTIYFLKVMLQPTGTSDIKKCTYKVEKFR